MAEFKSVKWGPGWRTIEVVAKRRGWLVEIGHNPDSYHPYCVQYAGNGHYFPTLPEAHAYCRGRKWELGPEIIRMDADCCQREGWELLGMAREKKGGNIAVLHNPMAEQPYCVLNRGRGYPFNSLHEARDFCYGRGWLAHDGLIYKEADHAV